MRKSASLATVAVLAALAATSSAAQGTPIDRAGLYVDAGASFAQMNNAYQLIETNGAVNAPYAASKAGVEQLGRALRAELAPHGATASVLYPGWVNTPLIKVAFGGNAAATELVRHTEPRPLRTPITPERVAAATIRGIERRSARIIVPGRWIPFSVLRGS